VARCVRGRVEVLPGGGTKADYDEKSCFWGPNGPRIRIGVDQVIRANLLPRYTCKTARPIRKEIWNTVGTAISSDVGSGNWESWIEFQNFGTATAELSVPATERKTTGDGYKVDFGQRLRALAFRVTLEDDRVLKAIKRMDPVPAPEIGGTLGGWFDFDLERGQGAQTFP
jgi:hypothetical protein